MKVRRNFFFKGQYLSCFLFIFSAFGVSWVDGVGLTVSRPNKTEDEELTEETMAAFVASWDAGQLQTKEFNFPSKAEGEEGADDVADE